MMAGCQARRLNWFKPSHFTQQWCILLLLLLQMETVLRTIVPIITVECTEARHGETGRQIQAKDFLVKSEATLYSADLEMTRSRSIQCRSGTNTLNKRLMKWCYLQQNHKTGFERNKYSNSIRSQCSLFSVIKPQTMAPLLERIKPDASEN
jgi:hypothetical protein